MTITADRAASASIAVTIDGRPVEAPVGETILEVARKAGIYIPALCAYPGLEPLETEEPDRACQLCIVEVNGKVLRACSTQVAEGMAVETNSPRIQELRRHAMTAILRRHPNACLTCLRNVRCGPSDICLRHGALSERCVLCPKNKNCELQTAVAYIGTNPLPDVYQEKKLPVREDSPFFVRDNNLCILCKRCVRVCEKVRGAKAIEAAYPCHVACPAGIDIPRYVRLAGRGRPSAALAVVREKVPFPGALGRVCVHPCEQACQRGLAVDKPLNIRMLKRYAA
ncbi:MAG: (2Fe-2S)-binding protein, partial [Chloroflexi bacterium]|nr:(2Fe-2S)-binding protein [Chloroflexota bacterium]